MDADKVVIGDMSTVIKQYAEQNAQPLHVRSDSAGSEENFVPFLDRLTPEQRKNFDKGMARLRKRFRNRNKFLPRLKRAIRNFH